MDQLSRSWQESGAMDESGRLGLESIFIDQSGRFEQENCSVVNQAGWTKELFHGSIGHIRARELFH